MSNRLPVANKITGITSLIGDRIKKAHAKAAHQASRRCVPDFCAFAGPESRQPLPVYRPAADFDAAIGILRVPRKLLRSVALRSQNPYVGIVA